MDDSQCGWLGRESMPEIRQIFIGAPEGTEAGQDFERKLYVIRKSVEEAVRQSGIPDSERFYVSSLSSTTIVYKGLLLPERVGEFYLDLKDPEFKSCMALVHQRFSTNTLPTWDRSHPYRLMAHNGEINTLRGNANWMRARESMFSSPSFGEDVRKISPVIEEMGSDSACFDNGLELLLRTGRSLPHAVMMMIPEAWQSDANMDQQKRDFYEFNSAIMEPWDGPASIVFSDGHYIGAVLDRNGLRPSRYYVTKDDKVIMASEVGVVHVDPANVLLKGRLQPGKMFLIDFEQGRLIPDEELKQTISAKRPYGDWLAEQKVTLADIAKSDNVLSLEDAEGEDALLRRMQAFGYTTETMQFMLIPLVTEARDPLGSMGNDSALACLSDKPRMIYDYFKQLFAQVTNPPIDSIREEVVMSLECFIGPEGNMLDTAPEQAHRLSLSHPILSNKELADIHDLETHGMRSKTIDITFDTDSASGYLDALDRACAEAEQAIADGFSFIVLSDRAMSSQRMAISALIACGAVHHHLVAARKRSQIGIVIETGEAREVHHFCLLTGYGADAVNPYLAFDSLWQASKEGLVSSNAESEEALVYGYKKSVAKGMLKVMAKMGISTLQSYKGAQIFEAVGIADEIVNRCFVGTASRVQGVKFPVLIEETRRRHALGYPKRESQRIPALNNPGDFHWRSGGDAHMWNPDSIFNLQVAARNNNVQAYAAFAKHTNEDSTRRCTFRGLLKFNTTVDSAIPIDEVEPASEIVKRFATGAMSLGSISRESHESLAVAMNRIGAKSNTGEGGEDPYRFAPMENGDSMRSAIKQVASGRFGVTAWYLTNADELQIKIAQGAKPGEGGELPGGKVDDYIASIRHSTPGVGLISPPPHHDIYSIEDIAQLIHDLKNANRAARISVKLVAEIGVGTIAAGVTKAKTDHLVISGHDGGTGASPLTSIKHAGLPWELGLAETHQTLVMNNLRSRVTLQTDGQLKTGRDIAIAALLGAEEFGFATAPLITLGCIMMRKCHLNTCPVGIATQDPELRKKFKGKPEHVTNYLFMVAEEMREIMASLGVRSVNEMVGRVDMLDMNHAIDHWKASGIDLTSILTPAKVVFENTGFYKTIEQDHGLDKALDNELIKLARDGIENGNVVHIEHDVVNINRVVGTMLSNEVAKRWKAEMLPDDTINIKLNGSAGQSLGAWLAKGVTLTVEGDANDFVGKGLSGGKIVLYPPKQSTFKAEDNIIAGNVNLYGATGGEAYIRGIVAERFAVRNSGASAVVEGIGDHGCEYMTGGRVVVLGSTGRNFGAGMSGGIAYVWDPKGEFPKQCNSETFELEGVADSADRDELHALVKKHYLYTDSAVAKRLMDDWDLALSQFVKVMPTDYKRVLAERAATAA
ncbi:MAG: glutamate synthase large subunit [Gammaproteobacteria bacterium]|nr:glutamate synthase large subunit [Gammaproteobacteria bacterium]